MARGYKARGVQEAREVMETPWMTLAECSQAIPPLYTELIGHQLMQLHQGRRVKLASLLAGFISQPFCSVPSRKRESRSPTPPSSGPPLRC